LKKLISLIKTEGLLPSFFIVTNKLCVKVRSLIYSLVYGAPGMSVSGRLKIRGVKRIDFGKGLFVNGDVWLEAVVSYAGKDYDPILKIGDGVSMSSGVHLSAINSITVGDGCLFGSNIYIGDHNHGFYGGGEGSAPSVPPAQRELSSSGSIALGENCWLGDNVVVCGGVRIGDGVIIGANSVVTSGIPDFSIACGSPARVIKKFNFDSKRWESCES
tara:strand:+ start:2032 stop:2679 length:648 start_codon:yes stop_codon:yes gene_type:complete